MKIRVDFFAFDLDLEVSWDLKAEFLTLGEELGELSLKFF